MAEDLSSPRVRYAQHKASAKQRGLTFTLTFEQWWSLWEPHWHRRGRGAQEMCMCRKADKGGYELGNVRIATNKENVQERALELRVARGQRGRRFQSREHRSDVGQAAGWIQKYSAFDDYSEEDSA